MNTIIKIKKLGKAFLDIWQSPHSAFLVSLAIYLLIAANHNSSSRWITPNNYYNFLADAFLHGQLYLRSIPASTHDLVLYQGKYYLYWPPFPAVLLTPFVLIFGTNFSDVLFTILIGSLNVGLVSLLLRQLDKAGIAPLDAAYRSLLVIFFALGSAQTPLAPFGDVWSTGQLVTFLFICTAYITAISLTGWQAFFFTGLTLACAMLTRNHTIFAGIWPLYILLKNNWGGNWKLLMRNLGMGGLPILIAGVLYLAYNYYRFESPFNIGYDYHLMDPFFRSNYSQYGLFNIHYIPINIYYQYIYYPYPWTVESFMGGSLFLLSPVLFSTFCGLWKGAPRLSIFFLALSIVITNIPILMLMGTGWIQVGPRYTLDFTVPLLILAAMGIRYWKSSAAVILTSLSCFQYFLGVLIRYTWR